MSTDKFKHSLAI